MKVRDLVFMLNQFPQDKEVKVMCPADWAATDVDTVSVENGIVIIRNA